MVQACWLQECFEERGWIAPGDHSWKNHADFSLKTRSALPEHLRSPTWLRAKLMIDDGLANKVLAGIFTGYRTRFIARPLAWIPSDEEREEIWEAASQRLSERAGWMAMSIIEIKEIFNMRLWVSWGGATGHLPLMFLSRSTSHS